MTSKTLAAFAVASFVFYGTASAQLTPGVTKVVKYSAATMIATKHVSGNCPTASIASRRSDAFRCMVDNEIFDPCFRIDAKSVACPDRAALNTGVIVALTKPLPPAQSPPPSPQAWAMVLESGAHCNRATGTVDPDFPFYCSGQRGQCSAPDLSKGRQAYFIRCAKSVSPQGQAEDVASTLAKIIYE
jgi:hypothetical protein